MTWYLVSIWFGEPGEPYRPVPKYTIAARSEAEARQLTELFLIDDAWEIASIAALGPFAPDDRGEHRSDDA